MQKVKKPDNCLTALDQGRIIFERDGYIGIVTLSRPNALNTITPTMIDSLGAIADAASEDKKLKGLIITGEGGNFAAGLDVTLLLEADAEEMRSAADRGRDVMNRIAGMPFPVVAAVQGQCIGGGFELALACHMRFAHHDASFAFPEVKIGLIPGFGGTQRLPRLIGVADALGLILSGEKIKAAHAARMGIVDRICDEDPVAEARAFFATFVDSSPLALRAALRAIRDGVRLPLDEGLALEGEVLDGIIDSNDLQEGVRAFLENRKPAFKGI